ncbi:MAG TPA: hypothetical protein VFV67_22205 [Actinophytocola sp.]|uniref:hypothetical protein n=1 Tax=Actinophytocola sp. TaxID=1872138 RepID=UPI002DB7BAE3|nr:hypothetical protein [Actinophytocola sp.]HEU5473365.1 hypothetical protein [Actinophytocola sp.]
MQIIENSIIGTRSAVLRLKHRNTPLQFLIFPMVHVASPRFYAEVAERLRRCDLLVIEGVRGRSLWGWAFTLSYRIMPLNRRSGLVVDNIPYMSLGVPLINPDVTVDELARGWKVMPLRYRLLLWCVLPAVVAGRMFGGRRSLLSRDVEVSDLPSESEEAFQDSDVGEHFERMFGGSRDQLLLDTLTEIHGTRSGEPIVVAIVYGARHVPAIVRGLGDRLGYRVGSAEWLTVLDA